MNPKEAREKLDRTAFTLAVSPSGPRREAYREEVMEAADAYALAAHVGACGIRQDEQNEFRICGDDGWYCAVAKELK